MSSMHQLVYKICGWCGRPCRELLPEGVCGVCAEDAEYIEHVSRMARANRLRARLEAIRKQRRANHENDDDA